MPEKQAFKNTLKPLAPRFWRRPLFLVVLVGSLALFLTMLALSYAYPAMEKIKNAPSPAEWVQKMERLGVCLIYYAARNDGALPPRLSVLLREGYVKDLSSFAASDMPGKLVNESDIDSGADFLYLLAGKTLTSEPQPALRQNLPDGRTLLISKKGLAWDLPPEPKGSPAKK